jgi:hypothetical protein
MGLLSRYACIIYAQGVPEWRTPAAISVQVEEFAQIQTVRAGKSALVVAIRSRHAL